MPNYVAQRMWFDMLGAQGPTHGNSKHYAVINIENLHSHHVTAVIVFHCVTKQ